MKYPKPRFCCLQSWFFSAISSVKTENVSILVLEMEGNGCYMIIWHSFLTVRTFLEILKKFWILESVKNFIKILKFKKKEENLEF